MSPACCGCWSPRSASPSATERSVARPQRPMSGTDSDTTVGRVPHGPGRPWPVQHNVPVRAPWTEHRWAALVLPLVAVGLLRRHDLAGRSPAPSTRSRHRARAGGYGWPYAAIGLVFGVCCAVVLLHDRAPGVRLGARLDRDLLGPRRAGPVLRPLRRPRRRGARRRQRRPVGAQPVRGVPADDRGRAAADLPDRAVPGGPLGPGRPGRAGADVPGRAAGRSSLRPTVAPPTSRCRPASTSTPARSRCPTAFTDAAIPVTLAVTILGVLVSMASVVVRYRRVDGVERDRMRWLAWSVLAMAVVLGLSAFSDLTVVRDASILVIASLPPVAMTIGIVRPQLVPVLDLLNATAVFALLSVVLVAVDLAAVALLDRVLRRRAGGAAGRDPGAAAHRAALRAAAAAALLGGPAAGARRPHPPLRRRRRARLDPRAGRRGLRAARGGRGRGRLGVRGRLRPRSRWSGPSGERLTATHGTAPAEVRTLPITYRGQEVGRVVLPARGLRSRLSRRDEQLLARPGPAGRHRRPDQPARRRAPGQPGAARASPARRSAAGSAATCTTGSGPSLSGVVFQLESARLLVDKDPDAAKRTHRRG